MIEDLNHLDRNEAIDTGLCIVGAGAAGITLARELAKSSIDVCILEGGGSEAESDSQDLYRGELAGMSYGALEGMRARMLGGTTNLWDGHCAPFDAIDFAKRTWVEHSGWPITAETLAPYYQPAQDVCEIGSQGFDPSILKDVNGGPPALAPHLLSPHLWRFGPPTRFGIRYREDLENARRLRLLLHANAIELTTDADATEVTSLIVRSLGGKQISIRARAFILATGGIENARLLLSSRAVQHGGLGNAHDQVGRYFMDHLHVRAGFVLPSDFKAAHRSFRVRNLNGVEVRPGVRLSDQLQRREKVLGGCAWFKVKTRRELESADAQSAFGQDVETFFQNVDHHLQSVADKSQPTTDQGRHEKGLAIYMMCEQAPHPNSRVRLSEQRDSLGQHRAAVDWQRSTQDWQTMGTVAQTVAREFARLGIGRTKIVESLLDKTATWDLPLNWGHHHTGTTRMSEVPESGVVDADCRVHGIRNLFVAGSSVFPTSACVSPTFTIVAMAIRLAEHIRSKLESSDGGMS